MKLFIKEMREIAPVGIISALTLIASGCVLDYKVFDEFLEPIKFLVGLRFILGMAFAAILGAMAYGVEAERGSNHFMNALPVSQQKISMTKLSAGLICLSLIYLSYYCLAPAFQLSRWWPLFLLAFAIAFFYGKALENTVNAAALSTAIAIAAFSAAVDTPFMIDHYALGVALMILASIALLAGSGFVRFKRN